ncbi:MAG: glycosyltransferase family 9 protein [Proteobacteria bacterium]|nr:glycosyltransferase family 9 protein [Pseudomonadota bacterium]
MPPARRPDLPSSAARGALVVRLCNWVGEVVLALPTLERLAAAGYALELVGKGWAPALLAGSGWPVHVRPRSLLAAARQLRGLPRVPGTPPGPDALLLTKSFSSALEARLGGRRAAGYARDARSWLLAAAWPLPRFAHAAHAYWHLADRLLGSAAPFPGGARLVTSAAQDARAHALLASHGLERGGYVLLCPFSGADDREQRKVWPGFAALGRLLEAQRLPQLVCPGPGEEPRVAAVLPRAISLAGVDLGVYAALARESRATVANDTGPGHLAAAAGAKLVSVYGSQSVAAWAPLGARVRLFHDPAGWPDAAHVLEAALGP